MLEESMSSVPPSSSSLWSSIFSWFTPTVFFVFVNLTIGTILFTSTFSSNNPGPASTSAVGGVGEAQTIQEDEKNDTRLVTSSSTLQSSHRSKDPVSFTSKIPDVGAEFHISFHQQTTPTHPPPPQQQPKEEGEEIKAPKEVGNEVTQGEERGFDETHSEVKRTKSDVEAASVELPIKLPRKMRKSASVKSPFSHFEEDEILEARRPATVRESKAKATVEDDEVDAKADDFINKFKQQLKLQRMDSLRKFK